MFYFLLCIILLLVVFIFLRDKQLRMRISAFLAGARRRSVIIRLKFQLKKERQKRGSLLCELGKRAWEQGIPVRDSDFLQTELTKLVERKKTSQMEWKKALDELERLNQQLEMARRSHVENVKSEEADLKDLEAEARRERHDLEKAIHYWSKLKERLEHRIKSIEAQEEALFYSLGKNLEEARVSHQQLDSLYSQIDTINQRISTLLHRIETLSGG